MRLGKAGPDRLPPVAFVSHEEAWAVFRFGPEYPKIFPGQQFPVEAEAELWKQLVPDWIEALPTPNPTVPALSELAQRINGTVRVSHSQSGIYPFQTVSLSTKRIAGIVAIEPGACPAAADEMRPYLNVPILVLFGDYVALSPRWSPRLQVCRAFVQAAVKAGARAELVMLPDVGVSRQFAHADAGQEQPFDCRLAAHVD